VIRWTTRRRSAAAPILLVACLADSGCGAATSGAAPSAVLITLDTTRADALTCYGAAPGVTPALDRLAAEGVRFEAAYAAAPLTLPSHASMLTGLYPPRHTLRNNGLGALPPAAQSLAELARASGRQTAAFIAAAVLDDAFGLDQGFEVYDTPRRVVHKNTVDYEERAGSAVVDAALAWLRGRDRERPFFLWVHLFDPHGPHEPPAAFRRFGSGYLGEVAAADHEVGRLLDALRSDGALDSTTVLVVGDHGEALGDHDEPTHGLYCYEATMRVPMILRLPGRLPDGVHGARAGVREGGIASVVDVHPTLAEALGLAPAADLDGISLFRTGPPAGRGAYIESYYGYFSYGWSPITGWVEAGGKYLHSSAPEYYDLQADPAEGQNLVGERADAVRRARAALRELAGRPALPRASAEAADAGLLAEIEKLGYAASRESGADVPGPLDDLRLPSPRTMTREDDAFRSAERSLLEERDLPEAERALRAILAENPRHYLARDVLGTCLILQERFAEALAVLREAVTLGSPVANTHVSIAICLIRLGRDEEAIEPLRSALAIDPGHLKALGNLVFTLEKLGRRDEAAPHRRRFAELSGEPLPGGG